MTFISPITALIAAGITVPVLVAMYFLKLRRRQIDVSSTLLWKRAIQDLQVNAPFQKLRRNLLLLLQLLALAGLLLAVARPTLRGAPMSGKRLAIVIDRSGSMNATDVSPTRLDRAKDMALQLIEDFEGAGGAMVVSFAHQARVVQPLTTDRGLLRQAVRSIEPTDEKSRLDAALQLVEHWASAGQSPDGSGGSAASGGEDAKADGLVIYVLSDGRVHGAADLALRGGEPRYVRMGPGDGDEPADNLAIVSMSARRDYRQPQKVQVFARLANFGAQPIEANLSLTLDGQLQRVSAVRVPAASASVQGGGGDEELGQPGSQSAQFELELAGGALVGVSHDHKDNLAADDSAWVTIAPPTQLHVLLVSPGNAFLRRVIEAVGVDQLKTMTPAAYDALDPVSLLRGSDLTPGAGGAAGAAAGASGGYDVIVFDGHSPKAVPPVPGLYLGAAPPIEGLRVVPFEKGQPVTQLVLDWKRDDPLVRYVAMDDVLLDRPGRLIVPDTAEVLATGQSGPLIAQVSAQGVRHVATSFSVLRSNWPMQISFAVFMSNVLHGLGLGGASGDGQSYQPGGVAVVPADAGAQRLVFDGPARLDAAVEHGRAVLPMFEHVGVYHAKRNVSAPWDRLAVNLADATESDLRPARRLQVGTVAVQPAATSDEPLRREVWRWAVWAALGMLMVEWVVYTRRMHL